VTTPFTPETLVYGLRAAGDPQIAPDGRRILYTLAKVDEATKKPQSHLWLCDIDGGNKSQLTQSGTANGGGRWAPAGTRIAFVSDRVKQAGIFVLPADGIGEARELTRHQQGISDLAWSPDGSRIAYVTAYDPDNPDEEQPKEDETPKVRVTQRIDYKQDGRGYLGDKRSHVFVVEVETGERTRLTEDAYDHAFPQWSPDGTRLAIQRGSYNGMRSQLVIVDAVSGEKTATVGTEEGEVDVWAWSPAGERIIFAGDTRRTFQPDFFVYDVAGGQTRRLTDDLQQLPASGYPGVAPQPRLVWLDERQVLFHAMRAGGSGLYVIDSERGSVEPLVTWQAMHAGLSADDAKRYIVQGRASLEDTGEIVVFDTRSGAANVISDYNAALLAEHTPAQWERFEVRRGEFTIEAWLLKPPDFDPSRQYPVVLDIHGGPNGFYGYAFNPLQQYLATNGYLVVYSNPRGSTSYGRHFTQQVTLDWGGEDYQDLLAVVDEVLKRPYADATRTGIKGYSYGGYMTSWMIGQTDRFQACVCGAPCFDLESMYGTSDISHEFGELQWGGAPHQSREWFAAHSPASFAHRATTPTLIIQGEADERCPVGQAEQMFVALKKAGVDTEFARYPGGAHGFPNNGPAEHRIDFLARTKRWFDEHL
jgi:dipeptidyl aminopeptidase/acylaminoacyl peptidase